MIVSATTLSGQALASDTGNPAGVAVECRNPNRHAPRSHPNSATRIHRYQPTNHALSFGRAVKLVGSLRIANPALVIYMAAQAFVRRSYAEPFEDVGFGIGRRVRSAN